MRISIFGIGYVGAVSAACIAAWGHQVIGTDVNPEKVALINRGASPVVEPGLPDLIAEVVARGLLRATTDPSFAVRESEVSVICVPTPGLADGSIDLRFLETVCRQIGSGLKEKPTFHVVIVRSTVPPGTVDQMVIPTLQRFSGRRLGEGFAVCANPEFLREGTAVDDFTNPPKTVFGATDDRAATVISELYGWLPGPHIRCPIEVAEMVKTVDNAWHATKVVFANEVGNLCKRLGIDSHEVMTAFCADTKLNLSSYYLKPGFAFGGSCLPKDLRSLNYIARSQGLEVPLLGSVSLSNSQQIERGFGMIVASGIGSIGFVGLSFKDNTDDLRESPLVELVKRLTGEGLNVHIYDPNINVGRLTGGNRSYQVEAIPEIERLLVGTLDELLADVELVVIGNRIGGIEGLASQLRPNQRVIDFVRLAAVEAGHPNYEGICW